MIKVIDNVVPGYIQDQIFQLITSQDPSKSYPLHYVNNLTEGNKNWDTNLDNEVGFGSNFFINGKISPYGSLLLTPLYLLSFSQNLIIRQIFRARVFFQIPNICIKPKPQKPHIDLLDQNHYSMIYYVTDTDGDTYFYNDKEGKDVIKQVSPKKGRMVFFEGNIWHSGSNTTKNLRIILNFNFLT
jgi:hypothetical protein